MSESDLERLTARVDALERTVAQLRYGIGAEPAAAPEAVPAPPKPEAKAAPVAAAPPPPPIKRRGDVESIVGGRGLLYAGAFLVLVGVASFLKIAFDRGWIGPSMRVALGIVAGAILIAGGNALRRRLHPYFADSLIGLGAAIEYLSFYAAGALFAVLPLPAVALGMIVVTGTLCVLAYREYRAALAYIGVIGGLVTPLLLGSENPDFLVLFTYLGVLAAGSIVLDDLRKWRALPIVSLLGTTVYWLTLALPPEGANPLWERLTVALVIYALFACTSLIAWRRGDSMDPWRVTVLALNATWFFVAVPTLAYGDSALWATVFLAIAAAHLLAGLATGQRSQLWLSTTALAFAISPVGHCFDKLLPHETIAAAVHLAWIAEATLVGLLAARAKDRVMLFLSIALFATAVVATLVEYDLGQIRVFFNERFISLAAAAIGLALVRRAASAAATIGDQPSILGKLAVDLIALFAISPEAMHLGQIVQPHNADAAATIALSIAWALYAGALIVLGIRARDSIARWEGLSLLAITVLKVLVVDLTGVDIVLRVVVALGIGALMLVLAYLYQSRLAASKGGE